MKAKMAGVGLILVGIALAGPPFSIGKEFTWRGRTAGKLASGTSRLGWRAYAFMRFLCAP
jgi:hypothetical protein